MAAKSKKARYIAKQLKEYFPKKFPTYSAALPEAKLVYAQILDAGEKVTNKNIFSKIRTPRLTKAGALEFILKSKGWKDMMTIEHYFDLSNFQQYLLKCPNNLGFTSKLLPSTTKQPVMGGATAVEQTYDSLFGPYITYINGIKSQTADEDQRYQSDWLIKITTPQNKGKYFLSEVVSVDINGQQIDYLFDPKSPNNKSDKVVLSGAEVPEKKVDTETVSPSELVQTPSAGNISDDQRFLLELEKQKERTEIAQTTKIQKKMDFIAQLKELGYTPAEIKKELDKL